MGFKDFARLFLTRLMDKPFIRLPLFLISRLGFLPSCIWKRLPVTNTFKISLPDGVFFKYSSVANDQIGRALYWRDLRTWEAGTIKVFYELSKKAKVVLDIGANTGIYTLLACSANKSSKVIAFEAVPHIFDRLKKKYQN